VNFADLQGAQVQRIIHINRHAPLIADGSFKEQPVAFIEAALEEYASSVSEVARFDRSVEPKEQN